MRQGKGFDTIIIHHSLTKDGEAVSWGAIEWFHRTMRGWKDIGYHFGVERINSRYFALLGRPMTMRGCHTKENNDSFGICYIGNYDREPPPKEMLLFGIERIVIPLIKIFNIPLKNILFHRDLNPGKTCPGAKFKKTVFFNLLGEALNA